MRIKKLIIENYKSFQYQTEIIFPYGDKNRTIFLIGGMNGAGKTSIKEAILFCLYGAKQDEIYKNINRREKARNNCFVTFSLILEQDDLSELFIKRSWSTGVSDNPKAKDMYETLVIKKDNNLVSLQSRQLYQDYIQATIPQSVTQFFFFDGEKIQEIASEDHSEIRLKSSLEAVLGIEYINHLVEYITALKSESRRNFVEVTDEDIDYKEAEIKREKSKRQKKAEERSEMKNSLSSLKEEYEQVKNQFQSIFDKVPETKEARQDLDRKKIQNNNRLNQLENEIKSICENYLPFSLLGKLFDNIKKQIEAERENAQIEIIRESASNLAKRIIRAVEEPEPIYKEKLSPMKMEELERRIFHLLKDYTSLTNIEKILNLSERDSSKFLGQLENIEKSDIFLLQPLIEEKMETQISLKLIEDALQSSDSTSLEKELFIELQEKMEGFNTQIGKKLEQIREIEEEIIAHENRINELEEELEKLYDKYNLSKEKVDFIKECDSIATTLNQFSEKLRMSKIHMLQEKTFEMYKLLSSKGDLIKDITIDDKSYEIKIIDRNGHEIRKPSLSAGEKEVFAISLLWGLAQTSQIKLPIIIDTPLSRLDSTHRDNIVTQYFPNAAEQVIILSTDTEIDNRCFKCLSASLSGAANLIFDHKQEMTTIQTGYFWEAD